MAGEANLLQWADSNSFDKIRDLFNVFSEKQRVLDLLDRALVAEGIQVFIGEESGHPVFEECSVISTPYHANGRVVGVLGVIGPTRMHYNKVISVVDMTAKLLSAALSTDDKNIHTIGDVNA
jgi:heat-inducible transcriptional repressor